MKTEKTMCDPCEWRLGLSKIAEAIEANDLAAVIRTNPALVRAVIEAGLEQHLRAARVVTCECHTVLKEG